MKEINLTQGKVALVDDADYEWLNQWRWHVSYRKSKRTELFYASRLECKDKKQKIILMHRFILNICDKKINVDHADGNGLNNQRFNLREATNSQNQANRNSLPGSTSKYKGVYWDEWAGKWKAQIKINNTVSHLGRFDIEEDAAMAYNESAIIVHGKFAKLNIIPILTSNPKL